MRNHQFTTPSMQLHFYRSLAPRIFRFPVQDYTPLCCSIGWTVSWLVTHFFPIVFWAFFVSLPPPKSRRLVPPCIWHCFSPKQSRLESNLQDGVTHNQLKKAHKNNENILKQSIALVEVRKMRSNHAFLARATYSNKSVRII